MRITKAAITPGTHPHKVNKKTIKIDPHPFPITDKGGNKIANNTLQKLIELVFLIKTSSSQNGYNLDNFASKRAAK